jgi:carbamoylphosphate synthase large subunit
MGGKATLTNVLVVSGGGFQGLSVLKGLLQDGTIRVVLADCYEENIGRYFAHRSYVVPPIAESDRFVDSLLAICEAEDIQIVFPATELELGILAGKAKTFWDRNVSVAVSSAEFLKRVCDKKELYEFLRQEQLPSPPSIEIASGSVNFPVLGKPRSGWGGKGQLVLRSKEELERHSLRGLQDGYVWQPFLRDFVEYSIDFAINLAGEISEFCIRESVRVSGGFAVIARSRED